jgi:ParB-like chromosome segregation protein Spo0J
MKPWPADAVERRPLSELIPSARNARVHSEEQIGQIAASIREWGWTMPVLVDEAGTIIAGHGRVLAASRLGLGEVPVMVARGWSDAQKRAYLLADNKLTDNSAWDQTLLRIELADLASIGFDVPIIGFTENEIEGLTADDTDPLAEWVGMPEFKQNAKAAHQTLAVHLKDAAAVDAFARLIGQPITNKTRFVWYPKAEIERYVDKQYAANDTPVSDLRSVERSSG